MHHLGAYKCLVGTFFSKIRSGDWRRWVLGAQSSLLLRNQRRRVTWTVGPFRQLALAPTTMVSRWSLNGDREPGRGVAGQWVWIDRWGDSTGRTCSDERSWTADHSWPQMTTDNHRWPQITTDDHRRAQLTTDDHRWAQLTTADHSWPQTSTDEHRWVQLTTAHHRWAQMSTDEHSWPHLTTAERCDQASEHVADHAATRNLTKQPDAAPASRPLFQFPHQCQF